MARPWSLLLFAVAACRGGGDADGDKAPAADAGPPPSAAAPGALRPPPKVVPSNPLGLPARKVALEAGQSVFVVPERMLEGAKEGGSLALTVAKVSGLEGDDVVVSAPDGASYRVHPAYLVPVPTKRALRARQVVVAEYAGALRHGVITRMERDRPRVRFVDVGDRAPELTLREGAAVFPAVEGLSPGNYAALGGLAEGPLHVLLVAPLVRGDRRAWLTLGFAGTARVVDEDRLVPIPLGLTPKNGQPVLAETLGRLRKATVESKADDGVYWVRFERAGKPEPVGVGSFLRIEALPLLEAMKPAPEAPLPVSPADEAKPKTFL